MSACAGKINCEIYRQKKYCRKAEAAEEDRECKGCRHARRQCDVEYCPFEVNGACKLEVEDAVAEQRARKVRRLQSRLEYVEQED